jgi:phage terminase small subunit
MSALTPRREKFAQKYIEIGDGSKAYRFAFNAKNMSDRAIWTEASRLLKNPKVALRVQELQERHQKPHEVTVDSLTRELDEARQLAIEIRQPAAIVSAVMGKAKLHGKIVDKSDVTMRKPINEMTDEELAAYAAEYEQRAGGVLPSDTGGEAEA